MKNNAALNTSVETLDNLIDLLEKVDRTERAKMDIKDVLTQMFRARNNLK